MAGPNRSRALGWLLLAILLGVATASSTGGPPKPVEAHALLERADPPVNSSIRDAPTVLTLYFTEGLEQRFTDVRVFDKDGNRVDDGLEFDASDDKVLRVKLKPLEPGFITVAWENVSAVDGHRISGTYPITILNQDGSVPAGAPLAVGSAVSGTQVRPERVATKVLLLIAGCALLGAFLFAYWVPRAFYGANAGNARRAVDSYSARLAGLALLMLIVVGAIELALQASEIGASLSEAIDTTWGQRWLLRNLALVVPLAALLFGRKSLSDNRALCLAGALGMAGYLAGTSSVSHGAAAGGAFWGGLLDFVHLLATSVWLGMLALLVLLFVWAVRNIGKGDRYEVLAPALQRFSQLAVASLALLLFTGIVNSVIELGSLSDLVNNGYGRALGLKLLLLIPLLGLGAVNAYILRPRYVFEADYVKPRVRQRLDELEAQLLRGVRWELGIAVAVLLVVGVLVQITPTRGGGSDMSNPVGEKYTQTAESDGISVTLVIDPNQPGINTFDVYLAGAVDTVESVRLDFQAPGGGDFGESRLIMEPSNPPTYYVGRGAYLTSPGSWKVAVDLRRRSSDLAIPFNVRVAGQGAVSESGGSGSFDLPFQLNAVRAGLIAVSAVLMVGLVAGSRVKEELPGGYLAEVAEGVVERLPSGGMRPVWSLAALVIVGVGFGLVLGSHLHPKLTNEQATANNPVESSPASIERGQMLFFQNCTQCHGESGRGDGPLSLSLPLQPANLYDHIPYHPDQFFFAVISNGLSGVMPAFSSISEEDRWNILNYLRDKFGQDPPQSRTGQ